MAHLSGLIDVKEEVPTLLVTERGTALLSLDDDTGLRFPTVAALEAWLEAADRLLAPGRDQYQANVRRLRDEKAAL